jgi:hypothetical protein
MSKIISKTELTKVLNAAEPLEIILEVIDRNETTSSKLTKVNRFVNEAHKQVRDERDVILITIKVK